MTIMLKLMASMIANTNRNPKKRNNPKENDFLPEDRSVYINFHQIITIQHIQILLSRFYQTFECYTILTQSRFIPEVRMSFSVFTITQLFLLMHYKNKFRNSDCNLKQIEHLFQESPVKRMRTTVSNTSIANLEFSYYRSTLANAGPVRPQSSIPAFKKQSPSLKDQLTTLQQKLNQAKTQMQLNFTHCQKPTSRPESRYLKPTPSTTVTLTSSRFNLKEDEETDQPSLKRYTSAMIKPRNVRNITGNPYSLGRNSHYYVSQAVRAIHEKNSMSAEHITTSIAILKQCQEAISQGQSIRKKPSKIRLPKSSHKDHKKTLILDLDQTLIHCFDNSQCQADLTLRVIIDQNPVEINFSIRPYAISFLKKMAKKWQIIIFTASHQNYANAILDEIDPENKYIQHRLYRQHCSILADMYVKDLSLINRDLQHTVLVDNAAYSYCLQLANGIPILPFYDGKDYELSALEGYLDKLYGVQDVREINSQYFNLHRYTEFENSVELIENLYGRGEESSQI